MQIGGFAMGQDNINPVTTLGIPVSVPLFNWVHMQKDQVRVFSRVPEGDLYMVDTDHDLKTVEKVWGRLNSAKGKSLKIPKKIRFGKVAKRGEVERKRINSAYLGAFILIDAMLLFGSDHKEAWKGGFELREVECATITVYKKGISDPYINAHLEKGEKVLSAFFVHGERLKGGALSIWYSVIDDDGNGNRDAEIYSVALSNTQGGVMTALATMRVDDAATSVYLKSYIEKLEGERPAQVAPGMPPSKPQKCIGVRR
jgi:hypothetical protein